MKLELHSGQWLNKPLQYEIDKSSVEITTEPNTDFWQRTYYGFKHDNAPALLFASDENFTFTVNVTFEYKQQFDQCGLILYVDSENWFKSSIEYENTTFSRLGSVVTKRGYSDWATSDISLPTKIWYQLSRRGPDFLIEYSLDGDSYRQMRIFHLDTLGETTEAMGKVNPPMPANNTVQFGIYACSPADSSFSARFTNFRLEPCRWLAHSSA